MSRRTQLAEWRKRVGDARPRRRVPFPEAFDDAAAQTGLDASAITDGVLAGDVIIAGTLYIPDRTGSRVELNNDTYWLEAFTAGGTRTFSIDHAGNVLFVGAIVGGSIDIPDTTSAHSFHVDSAGNMWSGANTAAGYAAGTFSVDAAGTVRISGATPKVDFQQASGQAAVGATAAINSFMRDAADSLVLESLISTRMDSLAVGATYAHLIFETKQNNVLATRLTLGSGVAVGSASDPGVGNLAVPGKVIGGGYAGSSASSTGLGVDGVSEFSSDLYVGGAPYFTSRNPVTLAASQNNYDPGAHTVILPITNTTASIDITGLAGGATGRQLAVYNSDASTQNVVLKNQSASSTATNRIALSGDVTLAPSDGVILMYDDSRWRRFG